MPFTTRLACASTPCQSHATPSCEHCNKHKRMHPFDFHAPASMPEALALLSAGAQPIAGGTDLLALMKNQVSAPRALVSLHQIAGFNRIIENDAGLRIGAGALIADLMRWPTLTDA